jgi:hypothetical protein
MSWRYVLVVAFTVSGIFAPSLFGQEIPFISEEEYRYLAGEISGDAAYEHIRHDTHFHRPRGGAPGLMEVARYYEDKAREYGLEDVRLLRQKASYPGWEAKSAELWIVEPKPERIADLIQTPLHLADYSRTVDVTAELVDVGAGTSEKDYEGVDVKDKVVLAWGSSRSVMAEAVVNRGALGIILRPDPSSPRAVHYSHQIPWNRLPPEQDKETFAFVLSHAQGTALARRLRGADEPIKVHVRVEAEMLDSWQVMVEAFIKGTDHMDQDVVLTGHMQEEKFSANDDASGCANVLEIGRSFAKLFREGKLPKPRRNLRFWWVTEIGSQRQFFADYPEEAGKILANINQDMSGANQAQDVMRVQNVTRVPFSRFHFLNDVAEAVIEFLVRTNSSQLAMAQAGTRQPYPMPVLSHLGSRHRYNAKMIPFHNNTDHMTFTEAPIGRPGITFTNWPDNYIHNSDDDLWNVDRTQLQRNGLAVAYMAYVMARAADDNADAVAGEVYSRGSRRLAEAFGVATRLIREQSDQTGGFRLAVNQINQAVEREVRAMTSITEVAPGKQPLTKTLADGIAKLGQTYQTQLREYYKAFTGETKVPEIRLTEKEKELEKIVPEIIAGPAEFLEKRGSVGRVPGLHGLMSFEVTNFIDGKRNGLQIYEATVAEALQAGEDYYGTVSPGKVAQHLDNLVKSGLVR